MAQAKVGIIIEAKDRASRQIKDVGRGLDGMKGRVDRMRPAFKTMAVAGSIAFVGIGIAIAKTTRQATNAQEIFNKFDVVFGSVSEQADQVAKDLRDNFGLAQSSAEDLLSATGDMLTGFGLSGAAALDLAEKTNKLAVDLASFTNIEGGAERASKALTKALLGERESVKELGIAILEVDVKAKVIAMRATGELTTETDRQAKAIATLQIAYEQSKNAIGDFARTTDSLANMERVLAERTKELSEEIGGLFTPMVQSAVTALMPMIEGITNFARENPKLTKTLIIVTTTIVGLTAVVGLLGIAIGLVTPKIIAATVAMAAFLGPITLIAGGLAIVASIISQKLNSSYDEAARKSNELASKTNALTDKLVSLRDPIIADANELKRFADDAKKAGDAVADMQARISDALETHTGVQSGIRQDIANEAISQEQKVADLTKALTDEKAAYKKSKEDDATRDERNRSRERISVIRADLATEQEALRAFFEGATDLDTEFIEARRRADLTEFERRVEDLRLRSEQEEKAFNKRIGQMNAELAELQAVRDKGKMIESNYTQFIIDENDKRVQSVQDTIDAINELNNSVGSSSSRSFPSVISHANSTPATMFADGGIVTRPTLGIVGEAGAEAVIPLSKLSSLGGGNTVNIYGGTFAGRDGARMIGDEIIRTLQLNMRS